MILNSLKRHTFIPIVKILNIGYLIAITFTGELTAANFILDTKTEEVIEKQHIKTKYEH